MVDTELFLKHFEREHGAELTMILQRVLDMAETIAESKQTYDEAPLQGRAIATASRVALTRRKRMALDEPSSL